MKTKVRGKGLNLRSDSVGGDHGEQGSWNMFLENNILRTEKRQRSLGTICSDLFGGEEKRRCHMAAALLVGNEFSTCKEKVAAGKPKLTEASMSYNIA